MATQITSFTGPMTPPDSSKPTTLRISWLDWDRGRRIFRTVSRLIPLRFYRFRSSDRYFLIYRTKLRPCRTVLPYIVTRPKEQIRKFCPCFASFRHSATIYNANGTVPSNEYSPIFFVSIRTALYIKNFPNKDYVSRPESQMPRLQNCVIYHALKRDRRCPCKYLGQTR